MLEGVGRVIRRTSLYLCWAGMIFILPLMAFTTVDVIARAVWNKPVPGTFELSEYLLAVAILLGAAYTQQVRGHVGVDFVTKRLGPRMKALSSCLCNLGCLVIVGLLAWQGYLRAVQETTVSDMLRIPQAPFRFLVFVAGVNLFAEFVLDLIGSIKALAGGER